ncbi:Arv1-domain-containing protein [Acaromyces ingoldii]|uniref:Protein ARV n=1 Tax=Acaromyces ingoldii TaxID=215250 RepID=A0A316YTB5_9BASI|nr:Arv1-domain-containing protein [Acaromyces ingoldii]PWN92024.1 Arv1-domain-containing protein [Acaromyces ingoldii]
MAVCVHCSAHTSSLFVSYGPTHLLCTRCSTCGQYADPYVEHEAVIVAIDLILVKPRAYRHVLFNRPHLRLPRRPDEASGPSNQKRRRSTRSERRASLSPNSSEGSDGPPSSLTLIASREKWMAWWKLAKRFAAILIIDAYLRWFYLCERRVQPS